MSIFVPKDTIPRKKSALVIGHVTYDQFGNTILPGGGAYYAAKTFHILGMDVGLVTAVGKDFFHYNDFVGIDVFKIVGEHTTVFINNYSNNGSRTQWIEKVAPKIMPDLLPIEWQYPDIFFITPVIGEINLSEWVGLVKASYTGIGLQGFLRKAIPETKAQPSHSRVVACPLGLNKNLLKFIDIAFVSNDDLEILNNKNEIDDLCRKISIVALTLGGEGSQIFWNGKIIDIGIAPASPIIDPTGAGDVYAAAFLFGLASDFPLLESARFATAAASIVIEGQGGKCLTKLSKAFSRATHVPILSSN